MGNGTVVRCTALILHYALTAACAVLLFLAGVRAASAEDDRQRVFVRALEAFDQAKTPEQFLESARLFESVLAGGYASGAVCYNLGNAYMRAGRVGPAIAAYRRAQRLLPRDPYVQANLEAALAAAPEAARPEGAPWWKKALFWHELLAQRERLWASAAAWALAFLLAVLRLLRFPSAGAARTWLGWGTLAALLLGALVSASAGLGYQEETLMRRLVIVEEVTARKGNADTYEPAFDRALKAGGEGVILEERGGWLHVQFAGAGDGWVPAKSTVPY